MHRTIAEFLDLPEIRDSLGVDKAVQNYSGCSKVVMRDFVAHNDRYSQMAQLYVAELLERGLDVLIYVGTYDMICNWVRCITYLLTCVLSFLVIGGQ